MIYEEQWSTLSSIIQWLATTSTTLRKSKTVIVCLADGTASLHASSMLDNAGIRSDPRGNLAIDGANNVNEFMCGQNSGLHQDERPTND